jgi:hypothetical protein
MTAENNHSSHKRRVAGGAVPEVRDLRKRLKIAEQQRDQALLLNSSCFFPALKLTMAYLELTAEVRRLKADLYGCSL